MQFMEAVMRKALIVGTLAALVGGTGLVLADTSDRADGSHWQPSAEDMKAFTDARIAALKAGLELTSEQEKNWPAVETAIRDMAKARAERMAARASEPRPSDAIERLQRGAERLNAMATNLKKLADAAEPLYKSLDDGQKQRFTILMRAIRPHHHMGFAWRGRHDGNDERSKSGGSDNGSHPTNL